MAAINDQIKTQIMTYTAQQLISMIRKRHANRQLLLNSLTAFEMDNVPDEIKVSREKEAAVIRAVMNEQSDIMEIIDMLFPPIPVALIPEKSEDRPPVKKEKKPRAERK